MMHKNDENISESFGKSTWEDTEIHIKNQLG